jgi:aerobic C4-dicarboxylate transport protein
MPNIDWERVINQVAQNLRVRTSHGPSYAYILAAIVLGAILGVAAPSIGAAMKPLGDMFIAAVKLIITPIIFLTIVTGFGGSKDVSEVGRIAVKVLGYFLFFSTLALILGLTVALVVKPGAGINASLTALNTDAVKEYAQKAHESSISAFISDIIPTTLLSALTDGNILQTLFVAILVGVAMASAGPRVEGVRKVFEALSVLVFRCVSIIMMAAPIGAFGAIAYTIGKYGFRSVANLATLVGCFYLTSALFVAIVLGSVARLNGFRILHLLRYLRSELFIVLGTSSSEAALPMLMEKLEEAGCDQRVVGLVVPLGYSFNLDGTNIYMTLAALFIAQAFNIDLSASQIALLLLVAVISSKGAAGVTGAGFITLSATLAVVPTIPLAGLALILGIDRFMSECRSLTNFIGNAVATIVIARWEDALDVGQLHSALGHRRELHTA